IALESVAPETKLPQPLRIRLAWIGGSVAAAILLLVQVVHHFRHDLATHPAFTESLTSLYSGLGKPLVPRWDPRSYEVRQLGASGGEAGRLTVRASLKNTADRSLPLPLLRVVVQDRYGNRIAA